MIMNEKVTETDNLNIFCAGGDGGVKNRSYIIVNFDENSFF
jgi:hypothetical protein